MAGRRAFPRPAGSPGRNQKAPAAGRYPSTDGEGPQRDITPSPPSHGPMKRAPAQLPKVLRITLPGGVEMVLCRIECPEGGFRMGARGDQDSAEPVHTVAIPHAHYYLGKYPVTQEQYRAVASRMAALREGATRSHFKGSRRPVENVSWHESNRFCAALSALVPVQQLPKGHGFFCLPTEAEWEHACRAGTDTEYHTGDGEAALRQAGWFEGNSGNQTHDVDAKLPDGAPPKANEFGLCHMHGNVWEWCHDAWDGEAYRRRCDGDHDPGHAARVNDWLAWLRAWAGAGLKAPAADDEVKVTEDDRLRALRGGSWDFSAWWRPGGRIRFRGFRVCWVPGPAALAAASWNQHQAKEPRAPRVGAKAKRAETKGAGGSGATRRPRNATAKTARAAGSTKSVKPPSTKSPSKKPDRPSTRRTARPSKTRPPKRS